MDSTQTVVRFTATHHALLFAWIARAVVSRTGEARAEVIMRRAVRHYGRERGRRMAIRAKGAGCTLNLTDFIAWREWSTEPGEMEQKTAESGTLLTLSVHRCPWHSAWEKNNLMPYGRFYCLEVDDALVQGFNPDLRFDVISTRPEGADTCEFILHDARVPKVRPGKEAVMPWEYHIGHIYGTCNRVVIEAMGPEGETAMETALSDFAAHFGEQAAEIIRSYRNTDFNKLPPNAP